MKECKHKIPSDFYTKYENGRRLWKCSFCKNIGEWGSDWGYLGSIECLNCGHPDVKFVYCSQDCCNQLSKRQVISKGE